MEKLKLSRVLAVLLVALSLPSIIPVAAASWEADEVLSTPAAVEVKDAASEEADKQTEFQREVLRLVNAERENAKLNPLKVSEDLDKAAAVRAAEASSLFAHKRPDGSKVSTVFSKFNIAYSSAAENLAFGYSDAAKLVSAWMDSKGHRANILNSKLELASVGVFEDEGGKVFVALLFVAPKAA